MSAATRFLRILNRTLRFLYTEIDRLEDEIDWLKGGGEGFDIEAPFDPWRVE